MAEKGDFKHISVTAADEDELIVVGQNAIGPTSDGAAASVESAQAGHASAASESSPSAVDGAYREQTLQDLEAPPMSFTQKIVIIAAVVCIIGALVYYLLAMR